jgi:1-acyl-sn-glycerol-3-phosphate acyltransferase
LGETGYSVSPVGYWLVKLVSTPFVYLLWRIRVEGREHLPRHGPAIVAANHQSFCDSVFLPVVLRRRLTFLAKAEYFDSRRTAWFFRAVGMIPIRRSGGDVSQRALETGVSVLRRGRLLGVYPEGTRSPDDRVHRGRTGAARMVFETDVPVIPVGIVGTDRIQPVGCRYVHPFRPVTIRFGPPLRGRDVMSEPARTSGSPGTQVKEAARDTDPPCDSDGVRILTDRLMREIARLSDRAYVDEYIPARGGQGSEHDGLLAPPAGSVGIDEAKAGPGESGRFA